MICALAGKVEREIPFRALAQGDLIAYFEFVEPRRYLPVRNELKEKFQKSSREERKQSSRAAHDASRA